MEIPPSELIDKMSILKLKIERVGEEHLKEEFNKCEESLDLFNKEGIEIKKEWFNILYEINKKIWDLDFEIRDLVHKKIEDISKEEFKRIGKNSVEILNSMKERIAIKNRIVEETKLGFKETKKNHPSE